MRKSTEKKVLIYDVKDEKGTPLELINVQIFKDGKLDRVETFLGRHDRKEYVKVGTAKDLSAPGTIFSYSSYVRIQEGMMNYYLDAYRTNLKGLVYTENGGSYYVIQE